MPYATGLVSTYFMSRTVQAFYGLIVIVTTGCNYFLHRALEKPNTDSPGLIREIAGYRRMLLPDIAIKILGLILALTVYPPIMMYSVLAAAAYVFAIRFVKQTNKKNMEAKNE